MNKRNMLLALSLLVGMLYSQANSTVFTLDSCRILSIKNNKELRASEMKREAAGYNRKSAFTSYLPKISASGMYMRTGKELSLLNDDQKTMLSHIGDALSMPSLNEAGLEFVNALRTDTRNAAGVSVTLTQPVYMGGKIRAYNNIARYAEQMAADSYNIAYQDIVVSVDETYWEIVRLRSRRLLAENYLQLVEKLDSDVSRMIANGFATKADGLSVKVRVNEARVSLIQVDNGLEILKMKLCQLCGLPLDTNVSLADETEDGSMAVTDGISSVNELHGDRPELSALGRLASIQDEKVKLARADFLPTIALTGGYFTTYPSLFNSFEKKLRGTWNIGIAVKIPILTWGDRNYKVKSAKAEAAVARYNLDETRELIALQTAQCRQRVVEARQRYIASLDGQAEAEENLRYANLGLEEGLMPVNNVLEAQTAWLSAKTNLISAGIDLRLSYLYLKKSLGQIK